MSDLTPLFKPKSVALIGASANTTKYGYWTAKSLLEGGYKGRVYLITRSGGEILGHETYIDISKVPGVPMVDLASKIMTGAALTELGYGTGLYPAPPYFAGKVPVFSFEKLGDVNAYLGPEMKSTGEVLGLGKTKQEALFTGLTSAGMVVGQHPDGRHGVFVSVDTHDLGEIVSLAKKLDDLHFALYATEETAAAIARLGIDVVTVDGIRESDPAYALLARGCIDYIGYSGAL